MATDTAPAGENLRLIASNTRGHHQPRQAHLPSAARSSGRALVLAVQDLRAASASHRPAKRAFPRDVRRDRRVLPLLPLMERARGLAIALGTQANQLNSWERDVHSPSVLFLYRLAKLFARDMECFIDRDKLPEVK